MHIWWAAVAYDEVAVAAIVVDIAILVVVVIIVGSCVVVQLLALSLQYRDSANI